MKIATLNLVQRAAVLALLPLLAWSVWKWFAHPFVAQLGARQQISFICQDSPTCARIAAKKVFDREQRALQRRAVIVVPRRAQGDQIALRRAVERAIQDAADTAPQWQRHAILTMLPLEVHYD